MEMLMISFAAAWVIRHWWDGRRADYRDPGNQYQQGVLAPANSTAARPPRRSGPDMRYAVGWSAFQLRHGWPAMAEDVKSGWRDAQDAYRAWREGDESERHSPWDAWKRGWRQARRKLPKTRRQQHADAAKAAETAAAEAAAQEPQPAATAPPSPPLLPNRAPRNGDRMTTPTGEVAGITAYRAHLDETVNSANQRIEAAQAEIFNAEQEIAAHDTAHAQLGAVGMGSETTGDVASLVEAAQQRIAAAQTKLAAAEQAKANAEHAIANLHLQGHTYVEEAVKGATAKVANTDFYEK